MSAPLPPALPTNHAAERRVNELLAELVLLPVAANLAQLGFVKLAGQAGWATSRGALAMSLGPALFGAGMLFLTRMFWAAWAAWIIDLMLLALLGVGDLVVGHVLPVRLGLAVLALPLLAWRIAGLQKLQRTTPPASAGG